MTWRSAGKSRVAPLKTVSIPRLELTASVVAVRLHQTIVRELNIPEIQAFFWTDSEIVLRYINNAKTRFKTFVANRLAIIHDVTVPSQWKYVPSSLNPAALASRGISPDRITDLEKWSSGPEFLGDPSPDYPQQPDMTASINQSDVEVKTVFFVETNNISLDKMLEYVSNIQKLQET